MKSREKVVSIDKREVGFSNKARVVTTFGGKLQEEMNRKVKPVWMTGLPNLSKIKEQIVNTQNGVANAHEAQERRQYAQDAAAIVIKAEQEIAQINAIENDGGVLFSNQYLRNTSIGVFISRAIWGLSLL